MIKNYFKIALRNLVNSKAYTFIKTHQRNRNSQGPRGQCIGHMPDDDQGVFGVDHDFFFDSHSALICDDAPVVGPFRLPDDHFNGHVPDYWGRHLAGDHDHSQYPISQSSLDESGKESEIGVRKGIINELIIKN